MPAADLTKWPHNKMSNIVDEHPNWREVYDFDNWPVHKIRQVSVDSLKVLMRIDVWNHLPPETKSAITAICNGTGLQSELTVYTPDRLTSLADRHNAVEEARASIDPRALIQMAASAVATGDLCGSQLGPKERLDLLKWLGNKIMPDSRAIDAPETARNIDRTRRRAFNADDLKKLTRDELELLLASDSNLPPSETP